MTIINDLRNENITFGIEIECYVPREQLALNNIQIGMYHHGYALPTPLFPSGWNAQADASLSAPRGYRAIEIVSPPLTGTEGYDEIAQVSDALNSIDAITNSTCGVHVHVGALSILGYENIRDFDLVAKWLRNCFRLTSIHEHALYAIGNSVRRFQSDYVTSIKSRFDTDDFEHDKNYSDVETKVRREGRYQTLNATTMFRHEINRRTIEFRVFAPTLNKFKLLGYVMIAVGIAAKAATIRYTRKFRKDTNVNRDYMNATHRLHCLIGMNYDNAESPLAGITRDAFEKYGFRVKKNQRFNSKRFNDRAPADYVQYTNNRRGY